MDAMALVIPLAIDVPTYVPTHNTNTSIPLNMTINTCIYSVETVYFGLPRCIYVHYHNCEIIIWLGE